MKTAKTISFYSILFAIAGILLLHAGCAKEYSFEGSLLDSITPQPAIVITPFCAACRSQVLPDSSWQFSIDGIRYCGKAEKAIITLERTSFTFFGSSSCSADSGFVASVYLNTESLNASKENISAKLVCYYYDRIGPSYVWMSGSGQPLDLIIETYDRQTGLAVGRFTGFVLGVNSIRREIKEGRFRVRL